MPDSLPPALIQSLRGVSVLGVPLDNVSVLRLDLMGGAAPGNKSFKLRYNLARARARGVRRVLSFGGGWSNHLHALAAVGAELGLETIGVLRGGETPTAMLEDALRWGMQLHPVSREEYRRRDDPVYQQQVLAGFDDCLLIPEGGANVDGLLGCREIAALAESGDRHWERVVLAVGTGTTLAGLAAGMQHCREVVGIAALKGARDLDCRVASLLEAAGTPAQTPWRIEHQYHCGGFAKVSSELREFVPAFEAATGIPLEPLYTGKLMLAVHRQLAAGAWCTDRPLLAIHTGGLQGRRGFSWLASVANPA